MRFRNYQTQIFLSATAWHLYFLIIPKKAANYPKIILSFLQEAFRLKCNTCQIIAINSIESISCQIMKSCINPRSYTKHHIIIK